MIRVLIADDHPVVRRGLIQILSISEQIQIAGEASNGAELLECLRKRPVEVVLMDVGMPGRSGLELLPELRSEFPKIPILVLSQYPAEQIAVRAIRSGAAGYMNKETAPEELVNAILCVSQGRRYLTDTVAELLAANLQKNTQMPHEDLSNREFAVLRMIASGKTVSEIGVELNLSVKTISTYRARILEKMNLRNSAELTTYAITNGLVL